MQHISKPGCRRAAIPVCWLLLSIFVGCSEPLRTWPEIGTPERIEFSDPGYARTPEYQRRLKQLNQKLDRDPDDAALYSQRAALYEKSRQYAAAEEDLTAALELSRGKIIKDDQLLAELYVRRGLVVDAGDRTSDQAIQDFSRAIELAPDGWEARFYRWRARVSRGETEQARRDQAAGLKLKPEFFREAGIPRGGVI